MKAIQGNLPIDKKYKIINLIVGDEDNLTNCENCGNIIKNVAIIESENGLRYQIGLDCASALTSKDANYALSELQVMQAKKQMRKKTKFIAELKLAKTIIVDKNDNAFWFYLRDVDGWQSSWKGRGKYSEYEKYFPPTKIIAI